MPTQPVFQVLRELDDAVQQEIAKYLDDKLYSTDSFDSTKRLYDITSQLAGKDIIVSSTKLGLQDAIIDEKSASHYVNNTNLHTFAFELSFFRRDQNLTYTLLTEGWLTSPEKETEYYMLIWPSAKRDKIIKYSFNGKNYPYFTKEDITSVDYALVSRERVREYLAENGFDERWLGITMTTIRKRAAAQDSPYYKEQFRHLTFSCSAQLREMPVNVLIEKEDLFNMTLLSGTC